MNESIITIKNLMQQGLNDYIHYKEDIVISFISDLGLFKYPCHLKATTILICEQGEIECSINLKHYRIRNNSVLVNFPENILQLHQANNLKAFAIIISDAYLSSLALDTFQRAQYYLDFKRNGLFTLPQEEFNNILQYINLITHNLNDKNANNGELIKHLVSAFFTNVMILQQQFHEEKENSTFSKANYLILDRFFELANRYHVQERQLQFYANKMCMTPHHLTRVIRDISGKKPTEWISEFVISESKSLLKYSGKNIQEIARALNFPTQSSFGKYFKNQVGMTPKDFMQSEHAL